MPVHQTGFSGQAIVPYSHCNANDQGPEAGICHRNVAGSGDACYQCIITANDGKHIGIIKGGLLSAVGGLRQIPCSYCDGKGYRRV